MRYARETSRSEAAGYDFPGQAIAIATVAAFAAAAIEGGKIGWTNRMLIAGFLASAICAIAFVIIEAGHKTLMLPLSFFRNPTFSATSAVGVSINTAFYGLIFVLSLFFQQQKEYSPFDAGLAFLPMTAVVIAANIVAGRVAAALGARLPMILGHAIFAIGCFYLLGIDVTTSYPGLCWQLLAIGAGIGLVVPPLTSAVLGTVERRYSGVASGVLNASRQLGSVIGVAVFGSLIADPETFVRGAHDALAISAILVVIGGLTVVVFVDWKPRTSHTRRSVMARA
jgi:DHA2 family methylenomycin A resistance protein-like MFS transporter